MPVRLGENMFNIQEELAKLPEKPGVYIMKDKYKNIIYVGKASVLKNRVRQYFQKSNHTPKVAAMVERISEFEYIVTDSELEALILECNLIKKYRPKFNVLLKDDKNYPYIKVTMNEEYPRVIMTRKLLKDGARYFGPYSNAEAVRETIDLIKKLFPIRTCNRVLPRDIGKERPCLNYHIHQCLGPCQGNVDKNEYINLMKDICSFLGGKHDEIVKRLEAEMKEAAEKMQFEKAAKLRDKLSYLKQIAEKQKVLSTTMLDQDVIAFARDDSDSCVQVFFIRGGKLIGREHFIIEGVSEVDDNELMTSFIKQFYSAAAYVPKEIILQEDIDELNIIENWLSSKRDGRVYIKVPRKGEKLQLVEMVSQNALIALKRFKEKIISERSLYSDGLNEITNILGLDEKPERIEAYDISNTGATDIVGSMVVFENGMPKNKDYRRFKIKSFDMQNDYASMQEMLYRRFSHGLREMEEARNNAFSRDDIVNDININGEGTNDSNNNAKASKFAVLPQLILVDGGLGHVNAANEVLSKLHLNIPVWGMVKDDNHRTRGLVSQEEEYDLRQNITALRFVTMIQDEAHRFALEYNKKLRKKRYTTSELDEIEGIGPKKRKALIKHFGSINKLKAASLDEIMQVEGIGKSYAEKIYSYFHQ